VCYERSDGSKKETGLVTKITFTTARLQALESPATGRQYIYDAKAAGLALCVTAAGGRVFYFYRWSTDHHRPVRERLGKFPDLSIDQARKAVAELYGKQASGVDLIAERQSKRQEQKLQGLFDDWLEVHAKPRKRTWKDDKRQWDKYIAKTFGNRRLASLKASEIAKWHAQTGRDSGPVQANRAKALLATVLNYAVRLGLLVASPCRSVPNFPEQSRARFLLPAEMKRFFDALAVVGEPWHDFFQLCLFTGARRGNVASMSWNEIDLDRTTWTIPASKTKNKRTAVIALAPPAVMILQSRQDLTCGSPWVFPASSASGHTTDPRKAWERLRTASGLADLRMHDLRRSLGSWQAAAGASLAIIGASLGHADLKSTQVYARLQLDPVRAAVAQATNAMLLAASTPPKPAIPAGGVKAIEAEGEADGEV
jgi:integrase